MALTLKDKIIKVMLLSIPAILAEISSVVCNYIDAGMVGSLGATATASIGIVSTTQWLIGGLCMSATIGFTVQVAQSVGAKEIDQAKSILRQSILVCAGISVILMCVGTGISSHLPVWLGAESVIQPIATSYFFVFAVSLPIRMMRFLCGGMLQCSGDMKTPSILNILMCVLDVIFNTIFIFASRDISFLGTQITIPGFGLGVVGASIGTSLSEACVALIMLYSVVRSSKILNLKEKGSWRIQKEIIDRALHISLPIAFERVVRCGAQITSTKIVASLGTVSVAANSLAVTAESFCYLPGDGIGSAATTLVGQAVGAKDRKLARSYARLTSLLGIVFMTCTGILMWIFAPSIFGFLTPDSAVRELGVTVLRIECFAEPMFAASIVVAGALRGAGDTLIPSIFNLVSIWGVRITLAMILAPKIGLVGVWIAMAVELCVRGFLYLIRLYREKWLDRCVQLQ